MVNKSYPTIAVVLNAYKRTDYLSLQLDAIENQTMPPQSVYVWQNAGGDIDDALKSKFILAECSENLGVWARFAFALNINADYICIFDDDTIPGQRWLENCVNTMTTHEGLLGTRGLKFFSKKRYFPFDSFGWGDPNEETVQVDIVGHSWFFKREWLSAFWSELPPIEASHIAGEDIHFSYMLQKKLGLNTYVPPHPKDDLSLWGSLPEYGKKIGTDNVAISSSETALSRFDIALSYYTKNGFVLCMDLKDRIKKGIVVGPGVRTNKVFRKIVSKSLFMRTIAKKALHVLEKLGINI